MKMKRFLTVVFSLLLLLAFIGCSDDTNNSSVTNPNPETVSPTGYASGFVKTACNNEPVEGAIVSIAQFGLSAETDAKGAYSFDKRLPATTCIEQIEIDGEMEFEGNFPDVEVDGEVYIDYGYRGYYDVSITVPRTAKVNGATIGATEYTTTYWDRLQVRFATTQANTGYLSNNNVDKSIIVDLENSATFEIGKTDATIYGTAVFTNYSPVPAGFTVYLVNRSNSDNDASGDVGNMYPTTTTTDASGNFTLAGVERDQRYSVYVVDNMNKPSFRGYVRVETYCNTVPVLAGNDYGRIVVSSTDELCPFIAATSPVNYSDVSSTTGTAGLNVVLTFSEPIKATEYNTGKGLTLSPYFKGLNDDINVAYLGNKTGNIAHSFSWSTDMTQLTINIASEAIAPASIYTVEILNNRYLTDAVGHPLSFSPTLSGSFSCVDSGTSLGRVVSFSTYGAMEIDEDGTIKDLYVKDADELDYNDAPALDWTTVIGAKSYNTYCQLIQWPHSTTCDICDPDCVTASAGQLHPYMMVMQGDTTGGNLLWHWNDPTSPLSLWMLWANAFGDSNYRGPMGGDFIFVEDWGIKLAYNCFVRPVNADGVEGAASNIVTIEDTVAPKANYDTYWWDYADGNADNIPETTVITGWRVCFTEPMNEKLVEDITNWSLGAAFTSVHGIPVPTIASIDYSTTSWCADITLSGVGGDIATSWTSTIPGKPVPYNILDFVVKASGMIQDVSGNFIVDPIIYF